MPVRPTSAADQEVRPTVEGTSEAEAPAAEQDVSGPEGETTADAPVEPEVQTVKVKLNSEFDAENDQVKVFVPGLDEDLTDEDGYLTLTGSEVEVPVDVAVNLSPAVAEVPDNVKVAR
jgi:hypothetical protein